MMVFCPKPPSLHGASDYVYQWTSYIRRVILDKVVKVSKLYPLERQSVKDILFTYKTYTCVYTY